jgi:NTP pyrophosphatase (non-canonical NTP hydrolase)
MKEDNRPSVTTEDLKKIIETLGLFIGKKIQKHGDKAFHNPHHALGILVEEYHELVEAVRKNEDNEFNDEMMDIAVVAIWWLASKNAYEKMEKE